jgi:glycosyltransferase involved in cell wall biosynthesis
MTNNWPPKKYVVGFNRDRDFYQLPLALYDKGLLSSLVTDIYYPYDRPFLRNLPGLSAIRHRCSPSLPSSHVHSTWPALVPQIASRLSSDWLSQFEKVDRALSDAALAHAEREQANLFLYSQYAFRAFTSPRSRLMVKGLFMFHPHTDLIREILDQDFYNYPECEISHKAEFDVSGDPTRLDELRDEWRYADFIVCASSFTAKSLQHAGCRSEIISVVPYGIDVATVPFCDPLPDQNNCQFLFVGQGRQRKGLHHLLRAWDRVGLLNAELTVIATSIDSGIAARAGKNVRILTRQTRHELNKWLNSSHVFVMPSLVEGFGLVYLEALAAGCRCIGTRNTGLADLLGYFPPEAHALSIIDAGDIDQLAMAIQESYLMYRRRELDRVRIRGLTGLITWEKFRSKIGELAQAHC